jgi:hypothetical protein
LEIICGCKNTDIFELTPIHMGFFFFWIWEGGNDLDEIYTSLLSLGYLVVEQVFPIQFNIESVHFWSPTANWRRRPDDICSRSKSSNRASIGHRISQAYSLLCLQGDKIIFFNGETLSTTPK